MVLGADSAAGLGAECVALLWFLGVYLVTLAFVPALTRMRTGRGVAVVVASLLVAAALVDGVRIATGMPMSGVVNFLIVWLIPVVIGVAYARRLISVRAALAVAASAFAAQVLLAVFGPYEVSLVVTGTEHMSNTCPADASACAALHLDVVCIRRRCRTRAAMGAAAARVAGRRGRQRGSDDALPLAHPGHRGCDFRVARSGTRRLRR